MAIQRCLADCRKNSGRSIVMVDVQGMDYQEASVRWCKNRLEPFEAGWLRAQQRVQDCLQSVGELLPEHFRLNDESRP